MRNYRAPNVILKRQLRVLSLARWDYAACGYFLSEAINATTDHESTAVRWEASTLGFPHDRIGPSDEELRELWLKADVVHVHDAAALPTDVPPRPTVVTYHGTMYRNDPARFNAECADLGRLGTVATVDLTVHGLPWMPDCRPGLARYVDRTHGRFMVCHAPTKRHVKGTKAILDAGVENLILLEGVTWDEAMRKKGACAVTIDQFKLGPGCNAIEAWSMGQAVVADLEDPRALAELEELSDSLPFVRCPEEPREIRRTVERLGRDEEFYRDAALAGGRHYAKFHAPEAAAGMAVDYYMLAMEMHLGNAMRSPSQVVKVWGGKGVPPVDESGLVPIKYLGGNLGRETFTGPVTGKPYVFSAKPGERVRYVHALDAPGMMRMKLKKRHEFGPP